MVLKKKKDFDFTFLVEQNKDMDYLKLIKNKIVKKKIGCKELCPLCNRMCELELYHERNHNCSILGHGIINIHLKNNVKTKRSNLYNFLCVRGAIFKNFGNITMEFHSCDLVYNKNTQISYGSEREIFSNLKNKELKSWKINESKNNKSKKTNLKVFLKKFWKKYGENHCKINFYKFVGLNNPINVCLFYSKKEENINNENYKESIYSLKNDLEKHILNMNSNNNFDFYNINMFNEGNKCKLTLLTNINKTEENEFIHINKVRLKYNFKIFDDIIKENVEEKKNYKNYYFFALEDFDRICFNSIKNNIFYSQRIDEELKVFVLLLKNSKYFEVDFPMKNYFRKKLEMKKLNKEKSQKVLFEYLVFNKIIQSLTNKGISLN